MEHVPHLLVAVHEAKHAHSHTHAKNPPIALRLNARTLPLVAIYGMSHQP
jgi:hypothetical protein